MQREVIPLNERRIDIIILAFFTINLLFITYIVDLEQLVIANPAHFTYPLWPPGPAIDAIHWWGRTFDPLLLARPVYWKMTIWLDELVFGPFYVFAIYAFIKGKDWIRMPSVIYSSILFTNVVILMGGEFAGPPKAPSFLMVFLANASWWIFPVIIIARMWRSETPFTRPASVGSTQPSMAQTGASLSQGE